MRTEFLPVGKAVVRRWMVPASGSTSAVTVRLPTVAMICVASSGTPSAAATNCAVTSTLVASEVAERV